MHRRVPFPHPTSHLIDTLPSTHPFPSREASITLTIYINSQISLALCSLLQHFPSEQWPRPHSPQSSWTPSAVTSPSPIFSPSQAQTTLSTPWLSARSTETSPSPPPRTTYPSSTPSPPVRRLPLMFGHFPSPFTTSNLTPSTLFSQKPSNR